MATIEVNPEREGDWLRKSIMLAAEKRIEEIVAEEVEKAQAEVKRRIGAEIGRIGIEALSAYSMERMGQNLHITIKNAFAPMKTSQP